MISYSLFLGLMLYWLWCWAENGIQDTQYFLSIYFLLTLCSFVSVTTFIANFFLIIAPQLHLACPTTTHGHGSSSVLLHFNWDRAKLNRISSDILMMDRRFLPSLQVGLSLFTLLSQAILLAVVQPIMTLSLPLTFLAVYFIQKFYLTTSRQVRFLDLGKKALRSKELPPSGRLDGSTHASTKKFKSSSFLCSRGT